MSNSVTDGREKWVDFLKGVAILIVVVGHSGIGDKALITIYMFHMPLFFIISGYLYDDDSASFYDFFIRKVKSLIYPYFVLGNIVIVYNTLRSFLHGNYSLLDIEKRIIALLYGNYIWENNSAYIGTLWFLLALFCSEVIVFLIDHSKTRMCRITIVLLTLIVGIGLSICNMFIKIRLPWAADIACVSYVFLYIGRLYKRHNSRILKGNLICSILMVVVGGLIGIANSYAMYKMGFSIVHVDMLYLNYGIFPLFVIAASLISAGLMGISYHLYLNYRFLIIEHIGRISLLIMVVHLYVLIIVRHFTDNWFVNFFIASFISVVFGMIIEKKTPWIYKMEKQK